VSGKKAKDKTAGLTSFSPAYKITIKIVKVGGMSKITVLNKEVSYYQVNQEDYISTLLILHGTKIQTELMI